MNDLITQKEAADLRGVSRAAISYLVAQGRLRTREMYGRRLVYRREVLNFEKAKPGPKNTKQAEGNGRRATKKGGQK